MRKLIAWLVLISLLLSLAASVNAGDIQRRSLSHRRRLGGSVTPLDFDSSAVTFTAAMSIRAAPGPFAGAPIVQGDWDGTGTGDVLSFPRGDQVSGNWYDNLDKNQLSVVFWITPEWDGDDGLDHNIFTTNWFSLYKSSSNSLKASIYDGSGYHYPSVSVSGWTAGDTYSVVFRLDTKNTLDGTNYACWSIDDVHSFDADTMAGSYQPGTAIYVGSSSGTTFANAIIEGLTVYRRVLWDGAYGVDLGNGDEINLISGASDRDPTLVTGSWGVTFALPTDSTPAALDTTGHAWSMPHSSNVITATDGFMLDATPWDDWDDVGTPTSSGTLTSTEKIFSGGYYIENDAADEGKSAHFSGLDAGENYVIRAIGHSLTAGAQPRVVISDTTNGAEITRMTATLTTTTHITPTVMLFTFELPTTARNGSASDCTAIQVQLLNAASSGNIGWHQVELYENLIDNPGMDVGSGDPWIPSGWVNENLDAGDVVTGTTVHAGAASVGVETGWAGSGEGMKADTTSSNGTFFCAGIWQYESSGSIKVGINGGQHDQQDGTGDLSWSASGSGWQLYMGVGRVHTYDTADMLLDSEADGPEGFFDDAFEFELDFVTLTVTPASEANSAEGGGIRVDGGDTLTQAIPAGQLQHDRGLIRWSQTFRHDAGETTSFGHSSPVPRLVYFGTGTSYWNIYTNNTTATLALDSGSTCTETAAWQAISAGDTVLFEVEWWPGHIELRADGALWCDISETIWFDVDDSPSWYLGGRSIGNNIDSVISAP